MTRHGIDARLAHAIKEAGFTWSVEVTDRMRLVLTDRRQGVERYRGTPGECADWLRRG